MQQHSTTDEKLARATNISGQLWAYVRGEPLTGPACRDLCRELGCSRSTLYRWRSQLKRNLNAASLIPRKRGRRPLSRFLSDAHENIIKDCIRKHYLRKERIRFDDLLMRLVSEFQLQGVVDVSRFDAAPLIAFIAAKEMNYGIETDGRIPG